MDRKESKPYTSKRWTDIPIPRVIGHTEFTDEEKRENDKKMEDMMRKYGVLRSNERVRDSQIISEEQGI